MKAKHWKGALAVAAIAGILAFTACDNPAGGNSGDDDPVDDDPIVTVTSVTVGPGTAIVERGGSRNFTATVTGTGDPAQTVTWTVSGGGAGTSIGSTTGQLTVAAGETAIGLTVTATSTADTSKTGGAAVTVILPKAGMLSAAGNTVTGDAAYYYDPDYDSYKGVFIADRTVTLSPFQIAKYETTYELWYTVYRWATDTAARGDNVYAIANQGVEGHDGTEGAAPTEAGKYEPVTTITWRDAIVWCNAYSEMWGKEPVYYTDSGYTTVLRTSTNDTGTNTPADSAVMKPGANGYRLPTEAEWEYAARGGTPNPDGPFAYKWAGTDEESALGDYAWYYDNSYSLGSGHADYGTNPIGGKTGNGLGLHDMTGNVWEWCWDWYDSISSPETVSNPTGPDSGASRVFRGGSWSFVASGCAVARRGDLGPGSRSADLGFRVACP
jgi:formylglycine-generating enzyme required for sulfatase activity